MTFLGMHSNQLFVMCIECIVVSEVLILLNIYTVQTHLPSLLSRCPDFKGIRLCTNETMDKCPDYQNSHLMKMHQLYIKLFETTCSLISVLRIARSIK